MRVNCFFDDDPKIEQGNEQSGEEFKIQDSISIHLFTDFDWNHQAVKYYFVPTIFDPKDVVTISNSQGSLVELHLKLCSVILGRILL